LTEKLYTAGEEIANSVTHGIGAALSIAGAVWLIALASLYGTVWHIVSGSVFGGSLVILYTISTLYHSFQGPRLKYVFRILDHVSIYILIAGTYTPFTLVSLRGGWGWTLFGIVWGLAVIGIISKFFLIGKWPVLSTLIYIFMGWLIMIAIKPAIEAIPAGGLLLLLSGGLCYTAGTIFYALKIIPFHHMIWHVFVLGGSACHFLAVILYIIPYNN
jgi:hemolysin III